MHAARRFLLAGFIISAIIFTALLMRSSVPSYLQTRFLKGPDVARTLLRDEYYERAVRIMEQHPLIDGHNDIPHKYKNLVDYDLSKMDFALPQPSLQTDIPRIHEGKLGAQFWSVYAPCNTQIPIEYTQGQIDFVKKLCATYPEALECAYTTEDIDRIFPDRLPSLMGLEGGHQLGLGTNEQETLAVLRRFYNEGARYMTLTHNCNTFWAQAATNNGAFPEVRGLTPFGVTVIQEMNRLGMFVDLSHVAIETMHDALDASTAPIIFSHSSARAVNDNPRNVPDDVLLRLPKNGGVIMITFVGSFLVPVPPAYISDVVDHIDHVKNLIGADYIGIGGDYDGTTSLPVGLEDVSRYPYLFAELLRRGYTDNDLIKILGANLLRAMRQMEAVARNTEPVDVVYN
mmetsp:Transcript_2167/g.2417  ORF Transcript_2167/g.2417 Transcript_2167/m.2417 type:complete len:401 (-) Transcript_2167:99-1301(-)